MNCWRAGDLAVCISGGDWLRPATFLGLPILKRNPYGPRKGQIHRVAEVAIGKNHAVVLRFLEWPSQRWDAQEFRKVVRDEAKAADECEQLLKVLKRDRVRA